ncbi:MAG TPA: hypothetical protein VHA57_03405, partial [Actinomycetota bacterium]|nr:hypothetical protein [Actinomycetota bacterium]
MDIYRLWTLGGWLHLLRLRRLRFRRNRLRGLRSPLRRPGRCLVLDRAGCLLGLHALLALDGGRQCTVAKVFGIAGRHVGRTGVARAISS